MVATEARLGDTGDLGQFTGEGRRATEHAARIAGGLELFVNAGATSVSVDSVKAAYAAGTKAPESKQVIAEAKAEVKAEVKEAEAAPAGPDVPEDVIVKTAGDAKNFNLYVVHTNGVHGRIEPSDSRVGYSRLATLLELGKSVTDKALVLDACN